MPENPPPAPVPGHTPGGLPLRVPQANLVPQLRTGKPGAEAGDTAAGGRSPEEVRKIIGAYRSGTLRGRSDAARALGEHGPDAGQEPPR
ncbi:hypothetical protein SAMN04489712_102360 [Thermomonospora echinospora]|uniref:Uncharacterized protein n=1 Tax=Thermomonospora echinospora TaxID=1992 RepID=A0A1H5VKW9_9ACTN|nr:hypothetical protein [Thermomonospora echinospora]SEF87904.1 hypothetical protein SAMN04489712_102360 [Thermomonospora echinospora]